MRLLSSAAPLLLGELVCAGQHGNRKGEGLLVLRDLCWLLCPNTSVNELRGCCFIWKLALEKLFSPAAPDSVSVSFIHPFLPHVYGGQFLRKRLVYVLQEFRFVSTFVA